MITFSHASSKNWTWNILERFSTGYDVSLRFVCVTLFSIAYQTPTMVKKKREYIAKVYLTWDISFVKGLNVLRKTLQPKSGKAGRKRIAIDL